MKCLIYCLPEQTKWLKEYFSDVQPYFLRILNKPLLEYYIDFCTLIGISETRVIINHSNTDLESYFGDGTQWGINLSYGLVKPDDSLNKIFLKNSSFCKDSDLLIIFGYDFLHYQKDKKTYTFLSKINSDRKITKEDSAIYLLKKETNKFNIDLDKIPEFNKPGFFFTPINNIQAYYALSINLIRDHQTDFVLPGYSNENGVFLGKNVVYPKSVETEKPLMLGDNVQIKADCKIGPDTIIGNNVIVDFSTTIIKSIIYDLCYIGSDLEIIDKIIHKRKVIDPFTGEFTQIVDDFLVSDIQKNIMTKSFRRFVHSTIALFLMIIGAIPYLFFLGLRRLGHLRRSRRLCYLTLNGDSKKLYYWRVMTPNFLSTLFFRLSLNKYPLYKNVLKKDIFLVGNRILPQSSGALMHLNKLPSYQPGAFDYSAMVSSKPSEFEIDINELYYCNNYSLKLDLKIFFRALFNRFFSVWSRIVEDESRFIEE